MRKALLSLCFLTPLLAQAQVVANFEGLSLSGPDTFYVNYSQPNEDVGFDNGLMHFPSVFDTSFGGFWSNGFIYSNMTDSVTSGFTNLASAKAGAGYNGSAKYALYQQGFGGQAFIREVGHTWFVPTGFYATNSTYAFNAMRDGYFNAKKFGGATGNDPDWFLLTVHGYQGGFRKPDSVNFYLADFRSANNSQDYIIRDWTWVNMQSLGPVDSLSFHLSSSDTGQFGMNTPAFFCLDNFTTNIPIVSVRGIGAKAAVKLFPNPATDFLTIDLEEAAFRSIRLVDGAGRLVHQQQAQPKMVLHVQSLPAGMYYLQLMANDGQVTSQSFLKQ